MFLCSRVMCCLRPQSFTVRVKLKPLMSNISLRSLHNLALESSVNGCTLMSLTKEIYRKEFYRSRVKCAGGLFSGATCRNFVSLSTSQIGNFLCTFQDTFCISKEFSAGVRSQQLQQICNQCQRNYGSTTKKRTTLKASAKKAKLVKESLEETVREWKEDIVFTVPNALTSLRILLTPFLGYLVIHESYSWACGLFVVAGLTDLLDGYIARTFPGQASAFGSYLDPLADKLLVSVLFLSLTVTNLIPLPLTALVITRDALLITAAFYIRYSTLPPPKTIKRYFDVTHATAQLHPTFISKLNTAVQLFLVTASLGAPVFGYVDHTAMHALWYITAGTTVASGITYMFAKNTFKILRQTRKKQT